MKIVHCSDLHLGKRPSGSKKFSDTRYEDFFRAFDSLIAKLDTLTVDVLIIAGDFFDKREINANILEKTEALLQKLRAQKPNLQIIVIEGNHDVIQHHEDSWLEYLKRKGYMQVFSYKKDFAEQNFFRIGDVHFYPVGYPGFMIDKALEELAELLPQGEKNIVIVHTGLSGSDTLPGLVSTKTLDLFQDKVIYMAGGHIHSFQGYPKENPYFFIPGSLEFTNIPNEKSNQKGAVYFDTDTREFSFLEIPCRKRIRGETFSYQENIEEEFTAYLEKFSLTGEELLCIPLENRKKEYINTDRLEELASEAGALKTYFEIKNVLTLGEVGKEETVLGISEMEAALMKEWNILRNPTKLISNFSILKKLHEENDKKQFIDLFNRILEEDEDDSTENTTGKLSFS